MHSATGSIVFSLGVAAVVLAAWPAAGADAEPVSGRVTDVTLYRSQALVTRTVPLPGPKGSTEIVVGDLPEQIVADSLFAEGSASVEVRAVRFRTRAVGEEPREEVRKLDEALLAIRWKIEQNAKTQELLSKQLAYLEQLEGFVAPTAKVEMTKGVLNAETLEKVTLFDFQLRSQVAEQQMAAAKEAEQLKKETSLLERQRAELSTIATQTVREAVLFVEQRADGPATVRLNYLVGDCGWTPAYTFRADGDQKEVGVECNGLIHQMTGEDWDDVQLTLSTASPSLSAAGPGLASFPVTLSQDGDQPRLGDKELSAQLKGIRQRQGAALEQIQQAANLSEAIGSSWAVNAAANEFQTLELLSGKDLVNTLQSKEAEAAEGPSLSYRLAGPVSLASRSDQQMVRILQTTLASRFYHVATPVLTGHVYREAELVNTGAQDLLAGPTTVYLDGRFVGRGEIPTVARGQMLVAGFGAEAQLRARRELAERTESVQGGNRELSFRYRLIIENYKDEPTVVRVFDRLPHGDRKDEIRVTLSEMKDPIDDDVLYLRRERPKGILRWEIEVEAGAVREKARTIEYGFKLEFDRKYRLVTSGGDEQAQRDFEDLQMWRAAPAAPEEPTPAPLPAPMPAP